jgi:hypothetical protein
VHVQVGQGVAMNLVVEFHGPMQPVEDLGLGHSFTPKAAP